MNPKTGAVDMANPSDIQLIDHHTGKRPKAVKDSEPEPGTQGRASPPSPRRSASLPGRRIQNRMERRGFTGS